MSDKATRLQEVETDLTNGRLRTFASCEPETFEAHERMTDLEEMA